MRRDVLRRREREVDQAAWPKCCRLISVMADTRWSTVSVTHVLALWEGPFPPAHMSGGCSISRTF
jgi:hypothetical protein